MGEASNTHFRSSRTKKFKSHNDNGYGEDNADRFFSSFNYNVSTPPSSKRISCGQHESVIPIHVFRKNEYDQSRDRIHKDDKNFMHVDPHQVYPKKVIKRGHNQKAHSDLNESSIKSDAQKGRIDHPFSGSTQPVVFE